MATYEDGLIDGIKLFADSCTKFDCEDCPLAVMAGEGIPCQVFMKQFPKKSVSLLKEMGGQEVTYASEYSLRFPSSGGTAEKLHEAGLCRKLIFDGEAECTSGDCVSCWNESYRGSAE